MKNSTVCAFVLIFTFAITFGQTAIQYEISFENAVHHEAVIKATFSNLENKVLELRMSRTSPGRYALHEFAKNVYNFKAFDGTGNQLTVTRPNPYQWNVSGHEGTVRVSYTLFGDRGDGTYSQIDETHAHLNIPATFIFATGLEHRPVNVKFIPREDLGWKVATQLKPLGNNTFYAPGLDYFMDSPTEISNFTLREWEENSNGKSYKIKLVLHHQGSEEEADKYAEMAKKIVAQQKAVFGELPEFDFGEYTFLACYMPNVSGDGMEHRNSTVLTSTRSLSTAAERLIGTLSHEFFHCWNVERIRPRSLEPFNFTEVNMSGELWFAEGFTSYYTGLILCRAGLRTPEEYVQGLANGLNYVLNSPGREYFNITEMSYQAPFVDAARAVDPVNFGNTFISYYTYGSVLGLAMDLHLRNQTGDLSLDGFMRSVWVKYGIPEIPYNVRDLKATLAEYAGLEFSNQFFENFIFNGIAPDYTSLLNSVGVLFKKANPDKVYLGVSVSPKDSLMIINNYVKIGSPAYDASLEKGDIITSVNGQAINGAESFNLIVENLAPGNVIDISFLRYNVEKTTKLTLIASKEYKTELSEINGKKPGKKALEKRKDWLGPK